MCDFKIQNSREKHSMSSKSRAVFFYFYSSKNYNFLYTKTYSRNFLASYLEKS